MTLVHQAPQTPSPDRLYQGRVQLVEVKYIAFSLLLLYIQRKKFNNILTAHVQYQYETPCNIINLISDVSSYKLLHI